MKPSFSFGKWLGNRGKEGEGDNFNIIGNKGKQ